MDGKLIQKINAEGLTYLDENGYSMFIDFVACYQSHFGRTTSPEYIEQMKALNPHTRIWDAEGVKAYIAEQAEWKVVGCRDITGHSHVEMPFIEFYTEPRIRFHFESVDEFHKVRYLVDHCGWRTFDLS